MLLIIFIIVFVAIPIIFKYNIEIQRNIIFPICEYYYFMYLFYISGISFKLYVFAMLFNCLFYLGAIFLVVTNVTGITKLVTKIKSLHNVRDTWKPIIKF